MKQLLVLTDLYPPLFAPRIYSLTKYISQWGWSPIVFTGAYSGSKLFADFTPPCPVHYAPLPAIESIKHQLLGVQELLWQQKELDFVRFVKDIYRHKGYSKPDLILCFTHRKFPLTSGKLLAEYWDIPWIADCRDIIEQYADGEFLPRPIQFFGRRFRNIENIIGKHYSTLRHQALQTAQAVVTVSEWHQQVLSQEHRNVHLIHNGFDRDLFNPSFPNCSHFRIVYTGRILSLEMRNPELLFQALSLPEVKALPLELVFYTDKASSDILRPLASRYGETRLQIYPNISHSEVPQVLHQASLILLLGNEPKGDGPKGMVSTKLFEAMGVRKPTLLLPSISGEAADILRQSGVGIASNDPVAISSMILSLYNEWIQYGYTKANEANDIFINQFSRQDQALQFAQLLNSIV